MGTISIEKSEILSELLKRRGVPHNVLNAKHHEREAEIIAQAGQAGAITIATNMAGRGTDIVLGLEASPNRAGSISSAPNGTNPAASTISCGVAPADRGIPARADFTCHSKTIC